MKIRLMLSFQFALYQLYATSLCTYIYIYTHVQCTCTLVVTAIVKVACMFRCTYYKIFILIVW